MHVHTLKMSCRPIEHSVMCIDKLSKPRGWIVYQLLKQQQQQPRLQIVYILIAALMYWHMRTDVL